MTDFDLDCVGTDAPEPAVLPEIEAPEITELPEPNALEPIAPTELTAQEISALDDTAMPEAPQDTANEIEEAMNAASDDPGFDAYRDEMLLMNPDMDENTLLALYTNVEDRTPRQVELVDLARNPDHADQLSFACAETGEALRDENGDLIPTYWGAPDSQRPDGTARLDDGTFDFRECKDFTGNYAYNNLRKDIRSQAEDRYAALGDEQHTTFVVAANKLTVSQADRLQDLAEDCGVDLEFQTK